LAVNEWSYATTAPYSEPGRAARKTDGGFVELEEVVRPRREFLRCVARKEDQKTTYGLK
jgi:hypothetical protein